MDGVATISPAEGLAGVLDIDEMTVQLLGAGQEVGRSCCVIKYKVRPRARSSSLLADSR